VSGDPHARRTAAVTGTALPCGRDHGLRTANVLCFPQRDAVSHPAIHLTLLGHNIHDALA